jgi:hypothetical protein
VGSVFAIELGSSRLDFEEEESWVDAKLTFPRLANLLKRF